MSSFSHSKPVQLIYKENGELIINYDALDILKRIKNQIAVCVCVGPYRQGKSFLLNKILDDSNRFQIGHEDEPCTEGVWVYEHPDQMKDEKNNSFTVLMMDVEGMESEENSYGEMDTKLFLLALSLASMLIYNSKSALSGESIKKLAVAAAIRNKIMSENKENNNGLDESNLELNTDFVWIVRDFALIETDTPTNKLRKLLALEEFKPNNRFNAATNEKIRDETALKNKIKHAINNTFDKKQCFYVPVPVSDGTAGLTYEEALQSLNKLPYSSLRREFRDQIKKISNYIKDEIKVKQINDLRMTGPVFCEFLKQIVSSINKENVIYLNETINVCLKKIGKEVVEEAIKFYSSEMSELMDDHKFHKTEDFESQAKTIFEQAVEFLSDKLETYSDSVLYECEDEFAESSVSGKVFAIKNRYSQINAFRIKENNLNYGKKLYEKLNGMTIEVDSVSQFKDWFKSKLKGKLFDCHDFNAFWSELMLEIDFDQLEKKIEKHIKDEHAREKKRLENDIKKLKEMADRELQEEKENTEKERQKSIELKKTLDCSRARNELKDLPKNIYLRVDGQPDLRYKENRENMISSTGIRLKKDGTPDMRFKENKIRFGVKQEF